MRIEIRTVFVGLALTTFFCSPGQAADDPVKLAPAEPVATTISVPKWLRRPNGDDVARVYPQPALKHGVSGTAIMTCVVTATGAMSQCELNDEHPSGMGFGDAALRLSPLFAMTRTTADGHPVQGGRVRIPMRFTPPQ